MSVKKKLENLTKSYLPPPAARLAKRFAVHPRYRAQARACREGFVACGDRYPQKVLFVAGLPKSGTTWLERMISSYEGFHDLMIPDVAAYELATGGSHDYDLPEDMFDRFDGMLVLTKMHVHGSQHNIEVLGKASVRYVVLFRDLRDVAISYFHYVRSIPWHPEYPRYADKSLNEGLLLFSERTLPAYVAWVESWHANRDPETSLELRYEDMLENAVGVMTQVAALFQLDSSPSTVERIVEANSFKRLSEGRERGQDSNSSFFRKGVAGDWKNQFTPEARDRFKEVAGEFFVKFGYETDLSW